MKNPFVAPSTSEQPWMHDDLDPNFGYWLSDSLFVTVAWAAFAPIESAAIAPVVGRRKHKTNTAIEGVRVSKILVALGESVVAGSHCCSMQKKIGRKKKFCRAEYSIWWRRGTFEI